jgi:hypothetical protein
MKKAFLYIDILGFENIVRTNPTKVNTIFEIFDSLKVFRHSALQTVVFSDTVLIFNKDENFPADYYCTYLVEYAQELFYKLSMINVYFKGILTSGEFEFSQLANIQSYYGLALIDTYKDEGTLEGFGLYVDKNISNEIIVFDKVPFTEKYEFILLCQGLKNLYTATNGVLPIDINLLTETDTYSRIDEELRFFREIEYIKQNHPVKKVKNKYQKVYDIYKKELPLFFAKFEEEGFLPIVINDGYTGVIPFELLSEKELNLFASDIFELRDMDFLYKDGVTKNYFKKYTDLIAIKIKKDELEKIELNNITLLFSLSPGTAITNFFFPVNDKPMAGHVVVIDKHIIDYCEFNTEEVAAAILHELGHILNNPTNQKEREFYADYYAKRWGFGKHLANSLNKFLKKELPFIDEATKKEIEQRIAALNDNNQTPLNGNFKQLRV